jgi:hypothetical protein
MLRPQSGAAAQAPELAANPAATKPIRATNMP